MATDTFVLGKIGAPRGIKGDLRVKSYSGEFGHIQALKTVELRGEGRILRLKVLRATEYPDCNTIAFEGYPTPEAARALTGMEIFAGREAAAPLADNEWYVADLVGLALCDSAGTELAKVVSFLEGGADPLLEAGLPDGRKRLVPFRREFVGEVDLAKGRIELLAPWLLEE
jgi:16S rRNA processing protein RimM